MANVLTRFRDIMASNINSLLDKAENPEKMVDQYLRNLHKDLDKVKNETATVMAAEKRAAREVAECEERIADLEAYAERAVMAGNDADATKFLNEQEVYEEKLVSLNTAYEVAKANSDKMRQLHDKLCADIKTLQDKKDEIKSKLAVAKAQEKINGITSSVDYAGESMSAFERMEAKANAALDKANAMADLGGDNSDIGSLTRKYDNMDAKTSNVEDKLAALKARLNK